MTDEESKVLVNSLERGTCWDALMCKVAARRIAQLEARVAAADKLAERSRRLIDGYGFTSDGNDNWREVAAADLSELDDALAAYEATKEQSDG